MRTGPFRLVRRCGAAEAGAATHLERVGFTPVPSPDAAGLTCEYLDGQTRDRAARSSPTG